MHWIPPAAGRLLDVGCNQVELLSLCARLLPQVQLAGVDVNAAAVATARRTLPGMDIRESSGDPLPFASGMFDCVTCIEVIEHVPEALRRAILAEMCRVLAPGGPINTAVPACENVRLARCRQPPFSPAQDLSRSDRPGTSG
ncbi:MAG: class I SAM-dependent methyltransferase [Bryobacteraceae bacterium]